MEGDTVSDGRGGGQFSVTANGQLAPLVGGKVQCIGRSTVLCTVAYLNLVCCAVRFKTADILQYQDFLARLSRCLSLAAMLPTECTSQQVPTGSESPQYSHVHHVAPAHTSRAQHTPCDTICPRVLPYR